MTLAELDKNNCPPLQAVREAMEKAKEPKDILQWEISDHLKDFLNRVREVHTTYMGLMFAQANKEENTMKVSYKGVTGELVRLERTDASYNINTGAKVFKWELDIWDSLNSCKVSFPAVSIKDVKFLNGEVTYG